MSVLQQTGDNCLLTPEPILDRVREFLGGTIALARRDDEVRRLEARR